MKLYVITVFVLVAAVAFANAGLLDRFSKYRKLSHHLQKREMEDKPYGFSGAVRLPYMPEYMFKVQRTNNRGTQGADKIAAAAAPAVERSFRITERQEGEEEGERSREDESFEGERNVFRKSNPKFRSVRRSVEEERQEEDDEAQEEDAAERRLLRRTKREDEALSPGFTFLIRGKRSSDRPTPLKYSEYPYVAGAGVVDTEKRGEDFEKDQERRNFRGGFSDPSDYLTERDEERTYKRRESAPIRSEFSRPLDPLTEREYKNYWSERANRNEERTYHNRRGSAPESRQEEEEEEAEADEPEVEWPLNQAEEQQEQAEEQQEPAEEQQEPAEEQQEGPLSQQAPAASPQRNRRLRRLRSRVGGAATARRRFLGSASAEDVRRDEFPDLTLPYSSKRGAKLHHNFGAGPEHFGEARRFLDRGANFGVNQRFPLTDH